MPNFKSQINLSNSSLGLKTAQKHPLTSIFRIDSKNYHEFLAPNKTKLDNATLSDIKKSILF